MIREQRVPAGPKPAFPSGSPARSTKENISPISKPTTLPSDGPMLSTSSSDNRSLFYLRRNGAAHDLTDSSAGYDFLPSVSFDELHTSLESASTEFGLTQFPTSMGHAHILEDQPLVDRMAPQQPNVTHNGGTTRVAIQPNQSANTANRQSRTASILRRPSVAGRQASNNGSSVSSSSSIVDAPTAPAAMRNRRQSHYPPVSHGNAGKHPRKSIGPGAIDSDYGSRKRRPSFIANASDRTQPESARSSAEFGGGQVGSNARNSTTSRATRTKSIQPTPGVSGGSAAGNRSSILGSDQSQISEVFPRSPRGAANRGSTPGSGRRMSVVHGAHASHATGLGARTISPTDAQRMKRMSMHQPQSLSSIANASTADVRSASRSPSMIPRKTSTPSSLRTTPEPTRKSYSSGLSVGSTNSFNTHRTSTGSLPRGTVQSASTSRLPAPKALNIQEPPPVEEDEDVPPVPAIPKAFESPKDAPAEPSFVDKRKSVYAPDSSSVHSNSTSNLSSAPTNEPSKKTPKQAGTRRNAARKARGGLSSDVDQATNAAPSKRNLQPLQLPPIQLGPLSTPTTAKIAALRDQQGEDGKFSPSPARNTTTKTPTTPMTASKSSFFSRRRADGFAEQRALRSNSSARHGLGESPAATTSSSPTDSLSGASGKRDGRNPNVSPFLSSSAPKGDDMLKTHFAKSSTTGDMNHTIAVDLSSESKATKKPTGPGPRKNTKTHSKSPPEQSSPEEPQTPSSMSSLRRKLSLSWKRSNSKSSLNLPHGAAEKASDSSHGRQESLALPRIPVSAANNLNTTKAPSPHHAPKPSGNYLESRRRKSSASSLNAVVAQAGSKKVDVGNNSMIETSSQPRNSSMPRILRPRPSAASAKQQDPYTADLDKDDLVAEEEMKKLASKRKETEMAARTLDALRKRASPKESVSSHEAIRIAMLNIYERGEIIDYSDVYFCGTQNAHKVLGDLNSHAPNFGYDDDRGDYNIVVGDHLAYRYEIVDILGKGSFGQVVRCIDHKTGVLVAVKIIRNKKRFHQQALVEVNILQKLREWDAKNKHSMVNFTHSFYFRGHLCISTELLDMNLYEFIKSNSFRGFSLKLIRRFTKQMLSSLNLLKQHKVIHCDLKPENILLAHPLHSEIKVIDFGSSCFENEKVYTYIQSRFYRSPEVILGMTYGLPIDMWSLGCILAELHTGVPIFPGENEQEQLACIMEVFGPPEKHLIEKSTRKKLFFDSMGKPRLTVSSKGRRRRPSSKSLQQVLKCDDEPFLDFLSRCLRWDPDRRIKPDEAIRHEFITGQKSSVPVLRPHREASPIKRNNTISTPRPLPEPPGGIRTGPVLRPREAAGASPHKAAANSRRASTMNGAAATAAGPKRTSTGNSGISNTSAVGNSALPRVAGRNIGAKQDLASAGANVAMNRRAA